MTAYTFQQLINFTRTSAGTFVGSNGLIQNSPQSRNLLTWTQEFDNAVWTKNAATVTTDTSAAPDGTPTADTIVESATNDVHVAFQTTTLVALTTYTMSVYVRAGTRNFAMVRVGGGGFTIAPSVKATLTGSGSVSTIEGAVSASSITSVGNGWYRVSMTFVSTATTAGYTPQVGPHNNGSTAAYLGDGASGIFIWGAQLEQASTASDYTRNVGGLFPPRFDYDPVTLAPRGILIEEQRTNLLTYSAQFDDAAWAKSGVTVTANNTISPDGTSNADRVTSTGSSTLTQSAVATATSHTFTVFAKQGSGAGDGARFLLRNETSATNLVGILMDYSTGAFSYIAGTTGATVTPVGNGWWRITLSATSGITVGNALLAYVGFTGGGSAGQFMFAYGAQLEAGAFATSYIPTVASQVTRTADQASIVAPMFAPWYSQSEGTFVVEALTFKPASGATTGAAIGFTDGTTNNSQVFDYQASSIVAQTITGGASQAQIFQTYVANAVDKLAYGFAANNFAFARNGALVGTDTAGTVPTVNRLAIGSLLGSSGFLNGYVRRVTFYPVRLSNSQLIALTA